MWCENEKKITCNFGTKPHKWMKKRAYIEQCFGITRETKISFCYNKENNIDNAYFYCIPIDHYNMTYK